MTGSTTPTATPIRLGLRENIAQFSLPSGLVETATVAILLAAAACGLLGFAVLRGSGEAPMAP